MSKQRQAKVTPLNNPDLFRPATREDVDNPGIHEFYDASGCRWRRNGALKLWKTRPTEFRQPVKYGLYGFGYITHSNLDETWVKL
jgi:hypothetical protein